MEIKALGCYGGNDRNHGLTSFLINGSIAIDAGAITNALSFNEQQQIDHLIISHIHFDHICGLPFLIDNQFGSRTEPLTIYATAGVIKQLRQHVLNDICWPDFSVLPSREEPSIIYREVLPGEKFTIEDLEFLPVLVDHLVPAIGLIVSNGEKRWACSGDTGVTKQIWQIINDLPAMDLVFVECSFPNRLRSLAEDSRHLTPETVFSQLKGLNKRPPVYLYHCKPIYFEEVHQEIAELDYPSIEMLQQGAVFKL